MQELYRDKLSIIDEITLQAIKECLYERLVKEVPAINDTDDDIKIGQKTRAYEKSKDIIEKAILDIKSLKTGKTPIKGFAKER